MSLRMGSRFFCGNCGYDCETEADALTHVRKTEHISFTDMDRKNFDEYDTLIHLTIDSKFTICPICVTRILEHEKEVHTEKYHLT